MQNIGEEKAAERMVRAAFRTSNGRFNGIYHPVFDAEAAVVLLGGAGGGFDGPANIYQDIATELAKEKIAALRLDYRFPNHLDDCIIDTILGIQLLVEKGIESVGIIGWSFGGAVAITAAALDDNVKAVAAVATQCYGTEAARHLDDKPLLLLHGSADRTLPTSCSSHVYSIASGPKELEIFEDANHGLDQVRDRMLGRLRDFMVMHLKMP